MPVCNIRRFEMIKYSFGEDKESFYTAIPEIGFCMFFLYFAHDLAGKEINKVGEVSIIWNPMCVNEETAWIRNLLRELHSPLSTATLVYCDNGSDVYMSVNHVQHQRTKHIEIDIHFVRDMVTAGHVRVLHVPSRFQYADIFTKGLPTALFEDFRSSLSVRPPPAQTAGAY
ncbi:ribonuclease H-like domain-containing protein [Tanacetum coccineum]